MKPPEKDQKPKTTEETATPLKITRAQREYYRYTGVSAEVEKKKLQKKSTP